MSFVFGKAAFMTIIAHFQFSNSYWFMLIDQLILPSYPSSADPPVLS